MGRALVRRWATGAFGLAAAVLISSAIAPELLAFPYHERVGDTEVYAEQPIKAAIPRLVARSDVLLHKSAIYSGGYGRRIFLTDGGWRWHVLATQSSGAMAISRPFSEVIIVNRSDAARDLVFNGAPVAGSRSLSGVIAHERTHGLIRTRYGVLSDWAYPTWLREGYCDLVAGGGSLSDADAAALKARHETIPALVYYDGRKRVAAALAANGGSVDALFGQVR
ncbi:hypothetical protein GCM10011395_30720 [Sphingomonas psychrolutea]|uniref:Uncharacterized protein n=1 Tax=Sphingomonas psychrolutea TaxID=1259676 RepID=A0ABQ1H4X0_9SPHN|nr:hypothetical protein GCM10011395_30720 [Sphingomonas psychrolutea]